MKHLLNKQPQFSKELRTLRDSWWKSRAAEVREVEEMAKHPFSLQQMKEQTQRNKMILRDNAGRNS